MRLQNPHVLCFFALILIRAAPFTTKVKRSLDGDGLWHDLRVPAEELRPANTLTIGQCFNWRQAGADCWVGVLDHDVIAIRCKRRSRLGHRIFVVRNTILGQCRMCAPIMHGGRARSPVCPCGHEPVATTSVVRCLGFVPQCTAAHQPCVRSRASTGKLRPPLSSAASVVSRRKKTTAQTLVPQRLRSRPRSVHTSFWKYRWLLCTKHGRRGTTAWQLLLPIFRECELCGEL